MRELSSQIPRNPVENLTPPRLTSLTLKNDSPDIPIQLDHGRINHPLRPMLSPVDQLFQGQQRIRIVSRKIAFDLGHISTTDAEGTTHRKGSVTNWTLNAYIH
jgi:hypothetical protein